MWLDSQNKCMSVFKFPSVTKMILPTYYWLHVTRNFIFLLTHANRRKTISTKKKKNVLSFSVACLLTFLLLWRQQNCLLVKCARVTNDEWNRKKKFYKYKWKSWERKINACINIQRSDKIWKTKDYFLYCCAIDRVESIL